MNANQWNQDILLFLGILPTHNWIMMLQRRERKAEILETKGWYKIKAVTNATLSTHSKQLKH